MYIADGEIHPLSDHFCYILRYFPEHPIIEKNLKNISDLQLEFTSKYAQYLMKFDQGTVLRILINKLLPTIDGITDDTHQFIYREAKQDSMIAQNATISLKFKRSPLDNLTEKENEPQI